MATEPSRVEANRLYWETDASVGGIAEQLGVSRRALYELLQTAPLDVPCPDCGGALSFANRLARSAGEALCAGCGAVVTVEPVQPSRLPQAAARGSAGQVGFAAEGDAGTGERQANAPAAAGAAGVAAGDLEVRGDAVGARPPLPPAPLPAYDLEPRLKPADFAFAAAVGLIGGLLAGFLVSRARRARE